MKNIKITTKKMQSVTMRIKDHDQLQPIIEEKCNQEDGKHN